MKPLTQKCNKNLRHRFYAAKYRSGETSRNLFIEQPADCVAMIRGREGHGDIEDIIELLQCALQTYTVQRPSQQPSHTSAHTLHHTPLKTTRTMMTKRNKIRKNPRKIITFRHTLSQ